MRLHRTKKNALIFSCFTFLALPALANQIPEDTMDFSNMVDEVDKIMRQHHYNPSELQSEEYLSAHQSMKQLANRVDSKDGFIEGINKIWKNGPFSHVNIVNSESSAEQLALYLDNLNVGENGATLDWEKDIAILTVNTMMGRDTINRITEAYIEVANSQAKALVIDLRTNQGGAFAIRPLVSHLIKQPLEAGYFISKKWTSIQKRLPNASELATVSPWSGWSIRSFWNEIENVPIVKVVFEPESPHVELPVYILVSKITASAAELAIDALQSSGRVTVIGEPSAGKMLSQKPFDLPNGMQLFVPIADYYSVSTGRIEGNPLSPDILTPAEKGMQRALAEALKND